MSSMHEVEFIFYFKETLLTCQYADITKLGFKSSLQIKSNILEYRHIRQELPLNRDYLGLSINQQRQTIAFSRKTGVKMG
jgi:hypothetical protein